MDHFSIIQALCRVAIATPTPAVKKQIERLRDALREEGDAKQAAILSTLLTSSEKAQEMAPSRITRSRLHMTGEALTPNTPMPVDRETSTPLAQAVFPHQISEVPPIFSERVTAAIQSLLDEWLHLEALEAVNVTPTRTCLIYGAPGTGKTRLAMWLAKQLDLPVLVARLDSLVSSFLGTSARNIGNLFGFANRYRCLLLLDEFDALAKLRDDPQEVGEIKRIVNALLQNLDLRQPFGFTVGITNHPQLLDPAVWRRFEVQLEIPKPDFALREIISHTFLEPLPVPQTHLRLMSWFTDGMTGAEIETIARNYKKLHAMKAEGSGNILQAFRQFATLNSARIAQDRRKLLLGDDIELMTALHDADEPKLSISDIGDLFGIDKSTVSRKLRGRNSEVAP